MSERTVSSSEIYSGRVVSLRVDEVELEGGRRGRREVVLHRGAVCLVAVDDEENVLLVRQYRRPAERDLLEIPAGTLEEGEDPEACAAREIREETGLAAGRLERMLGFFSAPGFCTEYLHVYLATDLRPDRLPGDEDESIEVVRVPAAEAIAAAARGEYEDAKTIVGLLAYAARRGILPAL